MKKYFKRLKKKLHKVSFKDGSSDALAFAIVAPLICFLLVEICAYVQLSSNIHEITNALDVSGRSAVMCASYEDASDLCQMMAESSIRSSQISGVTTTIDYATADEEWTRGLLIKVTLEADIDTFSFIQNPFSINDHSVHIVKTMIYAVEGKGTTLHLSDSDRDLLARVIWGEGGNGEYSNFIPVNVPSDYVFPTGHPGTLDQIFCGSVLINRVQSSNFPDTFAGCVYQGTAGNPAYACAWGGSDRFEHPKQEAYDIADYLIDHGSQLPSGITGQAGKGINSGQIFGWMENPGGNTHEYTNMYNE